MLPYWLLFFVFAAGALTVRQTYAPAAPGAAPDWLAPANPLLLVAALLPALMIGFRYQVGADWDAYIEILEEIGATDFWTSLKLQEPSYAAINWLTAYFDLDIWVVNLICAAIFTTGLVQFARRQPNPWLAIVVAVPYLVIGVAMGYTRQGVAIGCVMMGLAAISKGSFLRFVFWCFVAGTFHRSAVILIPIVGLAYSRNRLQTILVAAVGAYVAYFAIFATAIEKYTYSYVENVYEAQGAGVRLAMNIAPALIFLRFSKRFNVTEPERNTWRLLAALALVCATLYFFIESTVIVDRIALYIIPLQLFVLSRLPNVFGYRDRASGAVTVLVIAYSGLVEFVWLNFANHAEYWLPYQLFPLGLFSGG